MPVNIPLVVVLWQNTNGQGARRTIIWDTPDLRDQNFNDKASSIGVHPGPDYDQWKVDHNGQEPTASLYEDIGFAGAVLTLTTGWYPDIHVRFAFGDKISSVRVPGEGADAAERTNTGADRIDSIPVVVEVFTDRLQGGKTAVIVENVDNIITYLGEEFNDAISSLRTSETSGGQNALATVCEHINRGGQRKQVAAGHKYDNLVTNGFNDMASSVYVIDPPAGDLLNPDD